MALFSNFVQNIFGNTPEPELEPSNPDNCKFMVVTTHKLSGVKDATLFDTDGEFKDFMKEHCPTAHLLFIRTEVFRMDLDAPATLVERHEHCTGNVDWETGKFNDKAAAMGLNAPRVATYPNISSAVTAVAYFN